MTSLSLTPPATVPHATEILIESGILKSLGSSLQKLGSFDRYFIIADAGISEITKTVVASLKNPPVYLVHTGDASKSFSEVETITAFLLEHHASRKSCVIGIGGGMVTDLAGFTASVFMRGVPCVLIPTSLLAMVDAAIGGKTAINSAGTKNIIGTITHPRAIIIDIDLALTLPKNQFAQGMTEVVKIAAVRDEEFFCWLEKNLSKILLRDRAAVTQCITRSVELKKKIVEEDERELFVRMFLNFGHTVGHAVEACSEYQLSHGEAISIGMALELAMTDCSDSERITSLLIKLGMPLSIPSSLDPDALWKRMRSDKKNTAGEVRIVVPSMLGEAIVKIITREQFFSAIHAA